MIGASKAVEQVLQNKLGTALAILTEERHRVTSREEVRAPHRDKEQREHMLQIALTVLKRPPGNSEVGPEEQSRARDRARRKIQSWTVNRSLDMITPEVINPAVSNLLSSSSLDLLAQLVQKWKEWKMSEVDDIIQSQARKKHAHWGQEWAKKRRTFLEEKHGLSLLTGKRKPNVPQVELHEEVSIRVIKLLEMTVVGTTRADKPINYPQEECPWATTSTTWDESNLLGLTVPKGKVDQVNKIVTTGLWEKYSLVRQERMSRQRRAGEEEIRLRRGTMEELEATDQRASEWKGNTHDVRGCWSGPCCYSKQRTRRT